MNKTTIGLSILLLLLAAATAWYFLYEKDSNPEYKEEITFAVDDIDEVHKILISERKKEEPIYLERSGDGWIVNDKYKARETAVNLVTEMLERIRVRNRPTQNMKDFAQKSLIDNNIKVQAIDKKGNTLTNFYIGGTTHDHVGTFIIKEGSNEMFVGYMPGWQGNLRERFVKRFLDDWRDKGLFEINPSEISSVRVEYPRQKSKSFQIDKSGTEYKITALNPLPDAKPLPPVNELNIDGYLDQYKRVGAEDFLNYSEHKEAVKNMTPFAVVSVTDNNGNKRELSFYPRLKYDEQRKEYYQDPDIKEVMRYWIMTNDGDFMMAQTHQVNKLFIDYKGLLKSE